MVNVHADSTSNLDLWTDRRASNVLRETGLVLPRKGAIRKLIRRSMMTANGRTTDIARAPDRAVLRQAVFPEVAARGGDILFVGTQAYTIDYPDILEADGGICWTIDCDQKAARFGVPDRHIVGSIVNLGSLLPTIRFKTIVLAGVLGFGVNRRSEQLAALQACATALAPDGFLILSWNDRRMSATVLEDAASRWFDYRPFGILPSRLWVKGCDQNFAFLRRSADRIADNGSARSALVDWSLSTSTSIMAAISAVLAIPVPV